MIAARWRRRQEVLKEDHAHWGMDYDERRRIVYDLLRKHVSHDEAMAFGRYGLGECHVLVFCLKAASMLQKKPGIMPRASIAKPGSVEALIPTRENGGLAKT
jgi:hypothetical protein